jgi:hypothetical protein
VGENGSPELAGRRSRFRRVLSSSSRHRLFAWLGRHPVEAFEWVLLAGGLAVLFFCLPHSLFGDDQVRFDDIERLLHDGDLSDSRYSLVMPIVSAPLLLLGEVVGSPEAWAARFNVVVVAVGAAVALRSLRGRIDPGLARRSLLVLLFASLLTNRLRDYNAEVLTATLFAVGIVLVVGRRHAVAGWTAMVVGVVNTPAALIALALVAGAESVRTRRLRFLLPVAAAALLIGLEAWVRRGSPFTSGYEGDHGFVTVLPYSGRPGFSYPFVLGVLAILFSFGRGLVFFAPGLLLWLSARTRREAAAHRRVTVLMLLAVVGLVLVYAKWWAWYGGLAWGPRFFVFAAVPAALLIAFRLQHAGESARADAVTLGVLVLSAWVGLAGAVADLSNLGFCARDEFALESLCWYSPEYSSLWLPLRDFPSLTASKIVTAAYCVLVFAYLAWPLVRTVALALSEAVDRSWFHGWRL